jgi:VWFA-related protein
MTQRLLLQALQTGLFLMLAATPLRAQSPAGPITPPSTGPSERTPASSNSVQPSSRQPQQPATLHVRVELVSAPVTVTDARGEMIMNLPQNRFHVFDNGVEQKIEHFDLGGQPLSIVLVVETSSRIEPILPQLRRTGIIFSQVVMGETGEAAVLGYDDGVSVLQNFTENPDRVESAIEHLREGTSGAQLYDALARAVGMLEDQRANRRRVVVVMAESVDHGSESKLGEALREAQLANVSIYTIGLSSTAAEFRATPDAEAPPEITPPGTYGLPPTPGVPQTPGTEAQRYGNMDLMALAVWAVMHASSEIRRKPLEIASTATGGSHVSTIRDKTIEKALDNVGGELHGQYVIGYRPPDNEPFGYHEIKVTVDKKNVSVRTRPGYYFAPPDSQ